MKLQQLRYFLEVCRRRLNISEAAEALYTSQPGISKQIKLLEEELGVHLFVRHGKRFVSLTPPGEAVMEIAERIFRDVRNIKNIGTDFAGHDEGRLTIAATHTQAKYTLPPLIADFLRAHPKVRLSLIAAAPKTIDRMMAEGEADIGLNNETDNRHTRLCRISAHREHRCLLVPQHHPLAALTRPLRTEDLSAHTLISTLPVEEDLPLLRLFDSETLPQTALNSPDTDIIKTHIRTGIGIGLLPETAHDPHRDHDLVRLSLRHLLPPDFTCIVLRRDSYLQSYACDFLQRYLPDLTADRIRETLLGGGEEDFSI